MNGEKAVPDLTGPPLCLNNYLQIEAVSRTSPFPLNG